MPIVVLTSSHVSLFGMAAAVYVPQRTFCMILYPECTDHYIHFSKSLESISVVSSHARVDPNLSTQSSTPVPRILSDNQCHGGERRKYVKTQRKKTRLKGSGARQWGRNENHITAATFFLVQRLSTPVNQRMA
ncbi:hypothetical protein BX666DRAFT_1998319 [Dichotomocladium elegans]|nr:hypothetical protein BX666DRAFT_1998319 [Dichotomocladium elegans]